MAAWGWFTTGSYGFVANVSNNFDNLQVLIQSTHTVYSEPVHSTPTSIPLFILFSAQRYAPSLPIQLAIHQAVEWRSLPASIYDALCTAKMAFNSLPNEILAQICSCLCFHCRSPGIFPNSNTKESRMDKITLARLCRASKMLCSFAQPVLFHYYATGNLARSVRTDFQEYNRSWDVEYWNFEDDKLPAFLRSLITRPDLALCIKSLQLQGFGDQDLCSPELMRLLFNAGNALNFKPPAGWRWKGWTEEPGDWSDYEPPTNRTYIVSYENFHPDFLDFHDWLRALAIALTPRTEMLMYICEGLSELDSFKETKTVLPALKTLALRGANDDYYFLSSIHPLLTVAPNLETLYALDCNGVKNSQSRYSLVAKGDMWIENLAVNKVHKLVLDEIPPAVF